MRLPPQPALALIRRELLQTLRLHRLVVALLVLVGIGVAVALLQTINAPEALGQGGNTSQVRLQQTNLLLQAAILLIVPGLAGASIASEREQGALELLSVSLIRPSGIVLGKLVNALGVVLCFAAAVAPILAATFFQAGLDPAEFIGVGLSLGATTFALAGAGLAFSAGSRSTVAALITSYGMAAFVYGLPFFFFAMFLDAFESVLFFQFDFSALRDGLSTVGTLLSPVGAYVSLYGAPRTADYQALHIALLSGVGAGGLAAAAWRVRRPLPPRKLDTTKPIDDPTLLARRRQSWPYYLLDPQRRKPNVPDGLNPVLFREFYWGVLGNASRAVRLYFLSLMLFLIMTSGLLAWLALNFVTSAPESVIAGGLALQSALLCLIGPGLLANALAQERSTGNWDNLRATLITSDHLILGKLVAGWLNLAPLFFGFCTSCLLLLFILPAWNVSVLPLLYGMGTALVLTLLTINLGLVASFLTRHAATAVVLSYALTYFFVHGAALGLNTLGGYVPFFYELAPLLSPVLPLLPSDHGVWSDSPLAPVSWLLAQAVALGVSVGCFVLVRSRFGQRLMRDA